MDNTRASIKAFNAENAGLGLNMKPLNEAVRRAPLLKPQSYFNVKRAVLLRMQFIDAMFTVYGYVSRRLLIQVFEYESASASRDLQMYVKANSSVYLNHATRRWEANGGFKPLEGLCHIQSEELIQIIERLYDIKLALVPVRTELAAVKGANHD